MKARFRRGQVAVFLVMIIVVICVLALLNVDTFVATRAKSRVQNAGDAAALAAASRQGSLLNEIGRLNLALVIAALDAYEGKITLDEYTRQCRDFRLKQRRLALLGPIKAMRDASDAAEANGMERDPAFSEIIEEHVKEIRMLYSGGSSIGYDPYKEPYPGAWTEYATALHDEAAAGLAAGPDNVEFYHAAGGHLLLRKEFYDAIAAKDWCWFHFNCESVLSDYSNWRDWGPLPTRNENAVGNSEVFSLHVEPRDCPILRVFPAGELARILGVYANIDVTPMAIMTNQLLRASQTWFFYDDSRWHRWFDGYSLAGEESGEFPVVGSVKPEYNVRGCAAVCRCEAAAPSAANDTVETVAWSGAAKPFGTTVDKYGNAVPANALGGFVLPCFDAVRLVPLDTVGGSNLGSADHDWIMHLRKHVPKYLDRGVSALASGCGYCDRLREWERPSFRREGVIWLRYNSNTCVRPTHGGSISGGGTRNGH